MCTIKLISYHQTMLSIKICCPFGANVTVLTAVKQQDMQDRCVCERESLTNTALVTKVY